METKAKACKYALDYIRAMCGFRMKEREEIQMHFVLLDEYDGRMDSCLVPLPRDCGSWASMPKEVVRDEIVDVVAATTPKYLVMVSEAWVVMPKNEAEFAAVMAYKRSHPDACLSEYPGAREVLHMFMEGEDMCRSYVTELVNGIPTWPPEITDVDNTSVSLAGVFNGMWAEGVQRAMQGADMN